MKKIESIIISLICAALVGCATRTNTSGSDFDAAKISSIKKGVTTSAELTALLGQPYNKSVKSEDEVIWDYFWARSTNTTSMGWTSPTITIEGYKKKLEVLLKHDVIVNFTFNEGPFHADGREGKK